jgi:hypothetical protein
MEGGVMSLLIKRASEIPAATGEEIRAAESNYRRGYWDGVLAACNEIIMGATQHDVRLWLFRELKSWVESGRDATACKTEYPPPCPHKRSYEEATLAPPTSMPEKSGGTSFVYAIGDGHGNVKIGAANDIKHRMRTLQTGNASRLYLIAYLPFGSRYDADRVEATAHSAADSDRRCGEWFAISDDAAWQTLLDAAEACCLDVSPVEVEHRVY